MYNVARYTNRTTYCFAIFKAMYTVYDTDENKSYAIINNISENSLPIMLNAICDKNPGQKYGFAIDMGLETGGFCYNKYDDFSSAVLRQIYPKGYDEANEYKAIIATGYKTIKLNSSLQENYEWYMNNSHVNEFMDTDYTDTDYDGLADYKEIKFVFGDHKSLVNDDDVTHIKLLTFAEIVDLLGGRYSYFNDEGKCFYVKNGLKRYMKTTSEKGNYPDSLKDAYILPINSDPTNPDGDKDGIGDMEEYTHKINSGFNPLKEDTVTIRDNLIDDSNCIKEKKTDYSGLNDDGCVSAEAISKGKYSDDGSETIMRPVLNFSRYVNSTSVFTIVPEQNSDYVISAGVNSKITVEKSSLWSYKKLTDESFYKLDTSVDGQVGVILEKGNKYRITIDNHNEDTDKFDVFDVKVWQNNWVYAPEGGYYTSNMLSDYIDDMAYRNNCYVKIYINSNMFDELKKIMALHNVQTSDLNSYYSKVALFSALVGFPALWVAQPIGVILVCEGVVIAIDTMVDAETEKRLQKDFYDIVYVGCDHGIIIEREIYETEHGIYDKYYEWNLPYYINKYHGSIRGKVITEISEGDIEWFF